jgi:hypothetical protein
MIIERPGFTWKHGIFERLRVFSSFYFHGNLTTLSKT